MKSWIIEAPSGTFSTAVIDVLCSGENRCYQTSKLDEKGILEQLMFQTRKLQTAAQER